MGNKYSAQYNEDEVLTRGNNDRAQRVPTTTDRWVSALQVSIGSPLCEAYHDPSLQVLEDRVEFGVASGKIAQLML